MKAAVIGANGQLGSDLTAFFEDCIPLSHQEIDVTEYDRCGILKKIRPDVVINTAAFHNVGECEGNPHKSFLVNSIGAKNIADICREIGAVSVYISTDYVFDGSKGYYTEDDIPNPVNMYGVSKYAGEIITRTRSPRHYIFRVSSLFGQQGARSKGGNFVETMIGLSHSRSEVTVVDDSFMSPTYTRDAAAVISRVVLAGLPFGIYHASNSGRCTWYEFAQKIFSILSLETTILPVPSSHYPSAARRPADSSLVDTRLAAGALHPRTWEEGLADYLRERGNPHPGGAGRAKNRDETEE